jgi:hypothetical protein
MIFNQLRLNCTLKDKCHISVAKVGLSAWNLL